MKKGKVAAAILAICMAAGSTCYAKESVKCISDDVNVSVDGKVGKTVSYNINGYNYFKLRDVAYLMKDTEAAFDVTWNDGTDSIIIETEKTYSGLYETEPQHGYTEALPSTSNIYLDDGIATFETYNINGYTYFKLRDLAEKIGFAVEWSDEEDKVILSSYSTVGKEPIAPSDYQKMLGRGMDVDWSKTRAGKTYYNEQVVKDFAEAGIDHVRIRIADDINEDMLKGLDRQIEDCLKNGVIPVIAYQADDFKNNPNAKNASDVVKWWGTVAERYKDVSYLLSFDLLIESTDELNKQPEKLNRLYEKVVAEIRKTNPERIIIISPVMRSDPEYLKELEIPTEHNGYLMAEWHFYAAGPSKTNEKKLWTTGTDEEKKLIQNKINAALEWQKDMGMPTWVGAWMAGNYNDGNDYTVDEQVRFADYMTDSLEKAGIPYAVNSDTKFYDRENGKWIESMIPLRNEIYGEAWN